MIELTKREDQIMQIVWRLEKAFIRDVLDELPEPKPHYNTVATLVKILVKKGVLKSEMMGNTHQYSPVQGFDEYRDTQISDIKEKFFENSFSKLVAHFAKNESLTAEEREELINIIKSKS